jgi:hypothetical protein
MSLPDIRFDRGRDLGEPALAHEDAALLLGPAHQLA